MELSNLLEKVEKIKALFLEGVRLVIPSAIDPKEDIRNIIDAEFNKSVLLFNEIFSICQSILSRMNKLD